jgi:hypothetical protein
MLIDKQNQLSDAQAFTATAASSNVIDLGVARDMAGGTVDDLKLLVQVNTGFTGTGTVQVQVQTSADNSSWSTLAQSDAIVGTSLVQGYRFFENGLPGPTSRYLRLNYVVSGSIGTGKIDAALVPSLDVQPVYARGYAA